MKQKIGFFRTLIRIHSLLLAGQCIFTAISLFVAGTEPYRIDGEAFSRNVQVAATLFSIGAIFAGFNLFKRSITRIRIRNLSAVKRVEQYKQACIIWWTFIEGPAFFATLCYLWTNNLSFFFLSCMHILILFFFRPRSENIILLLGLSGDDISKLDQQPSR